MMTKSLLRRTPLFLALVLASAPVWAADPPTPAQDKARHEDKATELDAVVVTASPLRGGVEDLAKPVEVLSGERLDEVRGATLGETVNSLPGVQTSNFGAGVGRPIIRGLDGARVSILSGGLQTQDVSTVSQDHAPAVESFLADQIEVLKGPSTLLYGSGAIGGVVNVVDGRIPESPPDDGASGRAEARYDSVSQGFTEMARVDVGNDRFAFHFDGVYRDNDDYKTPDGTQLNSFLKTKTGAVGGSLFGDWGFVGFARSRYHDTYGNPGEPGNPEEGELGVHLDMKQNRNELKGGINHLFSDNGTLRFSVADTDYEHIEFEGADVGTRFLKTATEGRAEYALTGLGGWDLAFGGQASNSEFEAIGEEAFVPRVQTHGRGIFGVAKRKWDAFQLDFGARVDDVRSDPADAAARDFKPVSASIGGIWHFAKDWDLTANLDRAERAPAEEELFANGPHIATASFEIGNPNLTEEAANQLEFGLHYHGDRIQAKLAAYYNRFDDYIFLVDTGEIVAGEEEDLPVRQWSQADARFRGFEGEATFKFADNWNLRVFGDTVRATFAEGGGNVPRIAPSRAGADLQWQQEGWRASLGAVRYAKQDKVAINETPTDGYTLVNAHVAYHWDMGNDDYSSGWEIFLDGSNLTDETARVHTSFLKDKVVLPGRGVSAGLRVFF
ncbi:TonB-dependent receptor [Luteimonas gilva]|uniref:TonB-dependent receptor n=2 Tax=Luteimonas gilva TaxID=2572684 RepID=A0A4U5JXK2_9GAMM|nr:TonB-dependent receptor [Luteimonas gilva]